MFIWAYFRLPETKDRSSAEIDWLFENRIPARKFATTEVIEVVASRVEKHELQKAEQP